MKKHIILVSDKFDSQGIERLREQQDFEVIYEGGCSRERFLELLPQADGLIIRSATRVDQEALSKAKNLKIIIRAGVGVDNIDIHDASQNGIIVENAPGGNTVSTAEQALALLFACARKIPQANASIKDHKWEKSRLKGIEITGKTIGIVGLGRIGKEVVSRSRALKMNVIGYDPYIPSESLKHLEIDLVSKEEILTHSDIITVHTPLTEDTRDFINCDNLKDLKTGVILINAARGGIYNEEALVEGLESEKIRAVALDVFSKEPLPSSSPLRKFENCILTPHLGASTSDAELAVAIETTDSMIIYFKSGEARNAFNFPTVDAESMDFLRPYYKGGMQVGKLLAQLVGDVQNIEINFHGEICNYELAPVESAIQYGVLQPAMKDEVNLVNAPVLLADRGIQINQKSYPEAKGFSSFIHLRLKDAGGKITELQYTSLRRQPIVFSLFDLPIEFKPEGILLSIKNKDTPGVVGTVGSFLGKRKINIAHFELSRNERGGDAYCILSIDELLNRNDLNAMKQLDHVIHVHQIDLR